MASINRDSISNLHDKISVTVSKEDYLDQFNATLKQLSKTANIPGFRKGNVPLGMIQKMYGKSVFSDEVLKSINSNLDTYIKEQELRLFGQPLVLEPKTPVSFDFKKPEDYTFDFEVGLVPDFKVTAIDEKSNVVKYDIEITDDMVAEEVENIRKRAGAFEDKESLEDEKDVAYIDYFTVGADEEEEPQQDVVEFALLPEGLKEALKGKGADFELEFVPAELLKEDELDEFMKSALRKEANDEEAKKATYKLVLTKAASLKIADVDEELFKKVFPNEEIKDEESFKNRLREEIGIETNRLAMDQLQNTIFELLLDTTEIELPETFLKKWLVQTNEEGKTEEDVDAEFPKFTKDLKWSLISDQLMSHYKINVSREEVENQIRSNALSSFGIQNVEDAPWIDSFLENMLKDNNTMDQTYRQLMIDKLFVAIAADLKVEEEPISMEKFTELVNKKNEEITKS